MRHKRLMGSVLLTTRDAVLGLIAFSVIAIFVLTKSGSEKTFILNDFLTLDSTRAAVDITTQSRGMKPSRLSPLEIQGAARAAKTAVPVTSNKTDVIFQRTSRTTAVFLLAFIFSAVVAFMLTFLRHLQKVKVYVVPSSRRESWA
ncbi:MAG: hypothetical protein ACRBCJ_14290 [Hyphomicrobiaceae bacterium]